MTTADETVHRLPEQLVWDVKYKGGRYFDDNTWVRALLDIKSVDPDRLDQTDRSMMLMVATRLESFKEKYSVHGFDDKESAYAVAMMLTFNKHERRDAIRDSESFILSARKDSLS